MSIILGNEKNVLVYGGPKIICWQFWTKKKRGKRCLGENIKNSYVMNGRVIVNYLIHVHCLTIDYANLRFSYRLAGDPIF